jgi:PAS domain S-box-containing protein
MTSKWRRSVRGKLTSIIMMTSATAVLVTCLGFTVSGLLNLRSRIESDLTTTSQMLATNSIAALTFGDQKAAQEVLNTLRSKRSIIAAAIYTTNGKPFARYEPAPGISIPRTVLASGFHDQADRVEMFYSILFDGERIGTLYVACDARDRNERLKQYAEIAAGIVLGSLLVAFVLSWRLQGRITEPIVELSRVAGLVTETKNFSVRAAHRTLNDGDEISNLMLGFNGMLAEIEQRDDRLLLIQTHLEKTVACRTEELTVANEELLSAKNAAERIAEINARLARESALILNSATDGILGLTSDNRATFLNPSGARMLGITLSEMEGKTLHQAIHHSYADGTPYPEADCENTQAVRLGEKVGLKEDTFWRPDGTSFPVEYASTPMLDENGTRCGAVVTFRDVTERRAIERLKSEFVSTVSHELRTPLTSIRGALGLLGSGLLGPMAEKGQRMLNIAVTNTDRLVRLINDILDLERIGSGKVELARSSVDAHTVMVQATQGLQTMADQAGVQLVIAPASGALWGDSDRIIQTLTNLIGNAIKFSQANTTVTVSGTARTGDFVFCVADQGRGVPEEKLVTIFDRFSQVDASDSRDKGGTGLGLAICQTIVAAHGGRIWAEKNDPAGSRFQFTIPLAPAIVAQQTTAPIKGDSEVIPALDLAGSAPAILVVEDDLDLARVMTTSLQSRGIRTIHAVTGHEAIRLCQEHEPSLIVLDLGLPDMDGFAVVRALRVSATLSNLPLIVYSALDVDRSDQARLRLGPTEFLTKSRCSLPDFEDHVVRLLDIVTSRKKNQQHAA